MDNAQSNQDPARRFEITVPEGAVADLGAFVLAQGGEMRELDGPLGIRAEDEPIPMERFIDRSVELFGTDVPGLNAIDYLSALRNATSGEMSVTSTGLLRWQTPAATNFIKGLGGPGIEHLTPSGAILDTTSPGLAQHLRSLVEAMHLPFPFTLEPTLYSSGQVERVSFAVAQGQATKESLAAAAAARGYAQGRLHGALGQMFDLLASVAGLPLPDRSESTEPPETDYITYEALSERVDGLSFDGHRLLFGKLDDLIKAQLVTGASKSAGEVILGGRLNPANLGTTARIGFEALTRASLQSVANTYPRTTSVTRLLSRIANETS